MENFIPYNAEVHTDQYGAFYAKLLKAQADFDKKPNKKTATILSDLKLYPKYGQMYKVPPVESAASKYIREKNLEVMEFALQVVMKFHTSK